MTAKTLGSALLTVPNVRKKVLVADDVLVNRVILSRLLDEQGYDVVECRTGTEAVRVFQEQDQDDSIFCVLMDINMPEMDGLEASLRIRQLEAQAAGRLQSPRGDAVVPHYEDVCEEQSSAHKPRKCRRIPICAVSACSEADQYCSPAVAHLDVESGPAWRQVGIDAFIVKPVDAAKLQQMFGNLHRQRSSFSLNQSSCFTEYKQWTESTDSTSKTDDTDAGIG